MTTTAPVLGFHCGVGRRNGIGDYMRRLDEAALPFALCSVADVGLVEEALGFTNAEHWIVYRPMVDAWNQLLEVPKHNGNSSNYTEDAATHTARVLSALESKPSLVANKHRIWIAILNEPDQDQSAYLARLMLDVAKAMNADDWRVVVTNWATGSQYLGDLDEPDHLALLRYAGANRDRCAIGIHEYSLDDDLFNAYPYLIGRWQFYDDVCDDHGIPRPQYIVKEFGMHENHALEPAQVIPQLRELMRRDRPDIPRMFWGMQPWHGSITEDTEQLVSPIIDFVLNERFAVEHLPPDEEPSPEPEPPMTIDHSAVSRRGMGYIGLQWGLITFAETFGKLDTVTGEKTVNYDNGQTFNYQWFQYISGAEGTAAIELLGDNQFGSPFWVKAPVETIEPPAITPPDTTTDFEFGAWPVDGGAVITQEFGANPSIYQQYGLPGHEGVDMRAAHGTPILAAFSGNVYRVGDERVSKAAGGHNYGVRVYIDNGVGYRATYAHLDSRAVDVGDEVRAGDVIGYADDTGNSNGSHLHFTLYHNGATARDETSFQHDIIDPTPYLLKFAPQRPYICGYNDHITKRDTIDIWDIMTSGDGKPYMVNVYKPNNPNPHQERYQNFVRGDNLFIVKNSQWEWWQLRTIGCEQMIYLVMDTSPDGENYYEKVGGIGWCPRHMSVGQRYDEKKPHAVTFYDKATGRDINSQYSGSTYDQTQLFEATETHIRIGREHREIHVFERGYGRVGWDSDWGRAERTEVWPDTHQNQPETIVLPNGERFTPEV